MTFLQPCEIYQKHLTSHIFSVTKLKQKKRIGSQPNNSILLHFFSNVPDWENND